MLFQLYNDLLCLPEIKLDFNCYFILLLNGKWVLFHSYVYMVAQEDMVSLNQNLFLRTVNVFLYRILHTGHYFEADASLTIMHV